MSRRFRKIKITDLAYIVIYDVKNENGMWETRSLKSSEPARPEFVKNLKALAKYFVDMCQLNIQYLGDVYVHEVNYSYPDNKPAYLQIKASAYLNGNNHTLKCSTPQWDVPTAQDKDHWTMNFYECLFLLEKEAWRYVDGERAQGVLFAETNNAESDGEEVENPMLEEDDGDE